MAIDVSEAICWDTAFPVNIIRTNPGKYDSEGVWQEGASRIIKAFASVQPIVVPIITDHDNEHTNRSFRFFCNKPLMFSNTETSQKSDVIIYENETYTLRKDDDWSGYGVHVAIGTRRTE